MKTPILILAPLIAFAACRIGPPVAVGTATVQVSVVNGQQFHLHHGEWVESVICDTLPKDTTENK